MIIVMNKMLPVVGSLILWYGTRYTVIGVNHKEKNTVTVNMNNGIKLTLWWNTNCPIGCQIIS